GQTGSIWDWGGGVNCLLNGRERERERLRVRGRERTLVVQARGAAQPPERAGDCNESGRWDSNPQRPPWKGGTLAIELRPRYCRNVSQTWPRLQCGRCSTRVRPGENEES